MFWKKDFFDRIMKTKMIWIPILVSKTPLWKLMLNFNTFSESFFRLALSFDLGVFLWCWLPESPYFLSEIACNKTTVSSRRKKDESVHESVRWLMVDEDRIEATHVKCRPCPFIHILYKFYPNFIQIFRNLLYRNVIQILTKCYPD